MAAVAVFTIAYCAIIRIIMHIATIRIITITTELILDIYQILRQYGADTQKKVCIFRIRPVLALVPMG